MNSGMVLARAVVVLEGDDSDLDKVLTRAEQHAIKTGDALKNVGEKLTEFISLEVAGLATEAFHAFAKSEDALTRMDAVLQASGGVAGATSDQMVALAKSLEQTTTFSDSTIESAESMLLTFQNVRNEAGKGNDVFNQTIGIATDLASVMGGDLSEATMMLGKALEDPTVGLTMLRRAGITLDAGVQQQIKSLYEHNKVLEAQKLILTTLREKIGGVADALAKTPMGQVKQFWTDIEHDFEKFGGTVASLVLPAIHQLDSLAKAVADMDDSWVNAIVVIGGLAGALGPILIAIGTIKVGWTKLDAVFAGSLGTVAAVIAAVLALGAAIYEVVTHWAWVKLQVVSFWTFIKEETFAAIDAILNVLELMYDKMTEGAAGLAAMPGPVGDAFRALLGPIAGGGKAIADFKKVVDDAMTANIVMASLTLADLQKQFDATGDSADKTGKKLTKATKVPPPPPTWAAAVGQALDDLQTALETTALKSAVLGNAYDATADRAAAYASAADAIAKTHVGLNTVLDKSGRTLSGLLATAQSLKVQDVMEQLSLALKDAGKQASVVGQNFDLAGAQASAYGSAVSALMGFHLGLNTALDKTGTTLGNLIEKQQQLTTISSAMQDLGNAMSSATEEGQGLGVAFDVEQAQASALQSAIEALIQKHVSLDTVLDQNGTTVTDLITQMQRLQDQSKIAAQFKTSFDDMLGSVVDFVFGAKQSFGEFVRSTLEGITKILIQMEAMRAMKKLFGGQDIFSSLAGILSGAASATGGAGSNGGAVGQMLANGIEGFATGGFMQPGQLGVVGERGPELISGGRSGITVTPLPAMGTTGSGGMGGPTVKAEVNVVATDSRDVERFFRENEGLVATSFLSAYQKSSALRRALGVKY